MVYVVSGATPDSCDSGQEGWATPSKFERALQKAAFPMIPLSKSSAVAARDDTEDGRFHRSVMTRKTEYPQQKNGLASPAALARARKAELCLLPQAEGLLWGVQSHHMCRHMSRLGAEGLVPQHLVLEDGQRQTRHEVCPQVSDDRDHVTPPPFHHDPFMTMFHHVMTGELCVPCVCTLLSYSRAVISWPGMMCLATSICMWMEIQRLAANRHAATGL